MKLHFGYILGLFAIALAACAGYVSVIGWGQLFAGAATVVMVIMGIIEAAKVATTIYLHKYWKESQKMVRAYLLIGVVATMSLTSVGIYGYLTNAYQVTANKLSIHDGEVGILEGKKGIFEQKISDNKSVIENKQKRANKLSDLREAQEVRLDSLVARQYWSNARQTRREIAAANEEIQKLAGEIDEVVAKNAVLADSVSAYQVKILELQSTSDVAGEIGPLKYIASLTGREMDSIINYLVLVIIFIFDPMAVTLVLASSNVFEIENKKRGKVKPESKSVKIDESPLIYVQPDKKDSDIPTKIYVDTTYADSFDEYGNYIPDVEEVEPEAEPEPEPTEGEDGEEDENVPTPEEAGDVIEVIEPEPEVKEEIKPENKANQVEFSARTGGVVRPEEIIENNKKEIESVIKREPVIPTGKIEGEDIKKIKGTRGYSVNVPEPKSGIQRIGSNKEYRNGDQNNIFYKRKK
jgi:hypothetical protein